MKTPRLVLASSVALMGVALVLAAPARPPRGDHAPELPAPDSPGLPGGFGGMGGTSGPARRASSSEKTSGAYTLDSGGKRTAKDGVYSATETDQSAILVTRNSKLVLTRPTVLSSGATSDEEASSFYGLNAAVLATRGGVIGITEGTINSSGHGANTVFAHGSGSSITLSRTKITASGAAAHGIMAADGGEITATDLDVSTSGVRSAPIATDRGGGSITVRGGRYRSTGTTSPGIYSTGDIRVSGADLLAADSEAAVVEGSNSLEIEHSVLFGARKHGVMIYQSFSGGAKGRRGAFTMTGGSLSAAEGPLFYVTNTTGRIHLSGVTLAPASGKLLLAATGEWGREGANGGRAHLTADAQTLAGDLAADADSSLVITLKNESTLTGAIQSGALVLDATSRWTATAPSTLTTLSATDDVDNPRDILARIRSYGYVITYDAARPENNWLNRQTHPLAGGGKLVPATDE